MSFSSILDVDAFSIRIAQKDMDNLPEILEAVSEERVKEMQRALALVWHRWGKRSSKWFAPTPCTDPASVVLK